MYGLPLQTAEDVRQNVQLATALAPQRIAIFGYAHVPWLKSNQRRIDESRLPGSFERVAQARTASETLTRIGYVPVGLDHFAMPSDELAIAARAGRLHRNFQGYTIDQADALIGLGASAIGKLPQGFVQSAADIGGYSRAIESGRFATARGLALSGDDCMRAHIIERLMCDLSVDLDAVVGECGAPVSGTFASELSALQPLAAEGMVQIDRGRVTITEQGRPYVRLVAAAFDTYLPREKARYSVAV